MVAPLEPKLDLAACGLPKDYEAGYDGDKKNARMRVLTSWFDLGKPQVFCKDADKLVQALRLWADYYIKPDPHNSGIYHYPDPEHKYEMVRRAFSPPLSPSQPAKTVQHAPRGSTKTVTFIQQLAPMAALCRPNTEILLSEKNKVRTLEEIRKVRLQIEMNERIQRDFGGKGMTYPRNRLEGYAWNDSQLDFIHLPGCRIMGHSIDSAQRGRHPLLWIIDDPERKKDSRNATFRKKFFDFLFQDGLPMVGPGGVVIWIATIPDPLSCVQMAMEGLIQAGDEDGSMERDERFDDWHKVRIKLVEELPDGSWISNWEAKHPAASIPELIKSMGKAAYEAEMQGNPMVADQFLLERDPMQHGYLLARDRGGDVWLLDLKTGVKTLWEEFKKEMVAFGGVDLADSLAAWATPGAVIFIGMYRGQVYVLDAFIRKRRAELLIQKAFGMCAVWQPRILGIEKVAMQNVVVRIAKRYAQELREDGKMAPSIRGIENSGKNKIQRIDAALTPLFSHCEIRLPWLDDKKADIESTLRRHDLVELVAPQRPAHLRELYNQIDVFTDEGGSGYVDGIDALEMAIRVAGGTKGGRKEERIHDTDATLERMRDLGFDIPDSRVPLEAWSPGMVKKAMTVAAVDPYMECDPYD